MRSGLAAVPCATRVDRFPCLTAHRCRIGISRAYAGAALDLLTDHDGVDVTAAVERRKQSEVLEAADHRGD